MTPSQTTEALAATARASFEAAVRRHGEGDAAGAKAGYRATLTADPDHAGAHRGLGLLLLRGRSTDAALDHLGRAVALVPASAMYRGDLGQALIRTGRTEEAIAQCLEAVRLDPASAETGTNLGDALLAHGDFKAAMTCYDEIVSRFPDDIVGRNGLGLALYRLGRIEEATAVFRDLIDRSPGTAEGHLNLGFALLLAGRYREGWPEYEWRHRVEGYEYDDATLDAPEWNGSPLQGRTILLHAEQGLGDTLFYSRLATLVAARGGKVLLEAQPELVHLLGTLVGPAVVFARGATRPTADIRCALPSCAGRLGIEFANIPATVPYLRADPADVERFRTRIGERASINVGLVWAGSPEFKGDRLRSPGLDVFSPLLEMERVRFFSLQCGAGRLQLLNHPAEGRITDLSRHLTDMAQTAAAMEALDLVITSCSAPAHLAGALGRPSWIVLPFAPDWRWMLGRSDSPWYPSVRLFRQERVGNWHTVIERVREALRAAASSGRSRAGA